MWWTVVSWDEGRESLSLHLTHCLGPSSKHNKLLSSVFFTLFRFNQNFIEVQVLVGEGKPIYIFETPAAEGSS